MSIKKPPTYKEIEINGIYEIPQILEHHCKHKQVKCLGKGYTGFIYQFVFECITCHKQFDVTDIQSEFTVIERN